MDRRTDRQADDEEIIPIRHPAYGGDKTGEQHEQISFPSRERKQGNHYVYAVIIKTNKQTLNNAVLQVDCSGLLCSC